MPHGALKAPLSHLRPLAPTLECSPRPDSPLRTAADLEPLSGALKLRQELVLELHAVHALLILKLICSSLEMAPGCVSCGSVGLE